PSSMGPQSTPSSAHVLGVHPGSQSSSGSSDPVPLSKGTEASDSPSSPSRFDAAPSVAAPPRDPGLHPQATEATNNAPKSQGRDVAYVIESSQRAGKSPEWGRWRRVHQPRSFFTCPSSSPGGRRT